jgi:hypothetical protein
VGVWAKVLRDREARPTRGQSVAIFMVAAIHFSGKEIQNSE